MNPESIQILNKHFNSDDQKGYHTTVDNDDIP